jgi:hypothetical protein
MTSSEKGSPVEARRPLAFEGRCPVETRRPLAFERLRPVETRRSLAFEGRCPVEARRSLVFEKRCPVEARRSLVFERRCPVEARRSLVFERRCPVETRRSLASEREPFFRRWALQCSDVHSFDAVAGIAILRVAEADSPFGSRSFGFLYSWRSWDLNGNREVAQLQRCANPFESYKVQ